MRRLTLLVSAATLLATMIGGPAVAADTVVQMQRAKPDGAAESLGTVTIAASSAGTTFKLDLHGLPPGQHGFHVHEKPSCEATTADGKPVPAGAAGGHMDPDHTAKHAGPGGEGHLGDLPVLDVAADGTATQTLSAPRLKDIDALKGHALMIHAGGDNYSDSPSPLGGGGGRFACGVIQ